MQALHSTNNAKQHHLKETQSTHWFLISALKVPIPSNSILQEISLDDVPIYKALGEYYTNKSRKTTFCSDHFFGNIIPPSIFKPDITTTATKNTD